MKSFATHYSMYKPPTSPPLPLYTTYVHYTFGLPVGEEVTDVLFEALQVFEGVVRPTRLLQQLTLIQHHLIELIVRFLCVCVCVCVCVYVHIYILCVGVCTVYQLC